MLSISDYRRDDGLGLASLVRRAEVSATELLDTAIARMRPAALERGGLPIGTQFVARLGEDALLFRLAGQIERAQPWFDRVPNGAASRPHAVRAA